MTWFGVSDKSQCETEEPCATGFGAYMKGRAEESTPAMEDGSANKVAFTLLANCALIVLPLACVIETVGIVIVLSEPAIPGGVEFETLSTMTTPIAPAFCAFFVFETKVQLPRSIRAILPVSELPKAEQPSTGFDCATCAVVPSADSAGPWRIGRGAVIGLALGAATLVHPVIGFFGILTVGVVALVRPREAAPDAFVAGLTAGLVALPQLATMIGLSLPTLALGISEPIAIVIGIAAGRQIARASRARAAVVHLAELGRVVVPVALIAAVGIAFGVGKLDTDRVPNALGQALAVTAESSGLLLLVLVVGVWLGSQGARSPIVVAGVGIGFAAVALVQALPGNLGFFGDALRFEVPKTVHYWMSGIAAAGAACAIATAWSGARLSVRWTVRATAVTAFVVVAALPLRFGNSGDDANCQADCSAINAYHLGEHRWSETFAIDLHYAAIGFWQGFPDPRLVVDAPRRELLDALRQEIDLGRLNHDTPVLHVASSFQQWSSTPLGVFDGVAETFISLDPEVSHQTIGGRLFGLDSLPGFLESGDFGYLVLEPKDLPPGIREQVIGAGYASIFANDQGEVFRRSG